MCRYDTEGNQAPLPLDKHRYLHPDGRRLITTWFDRAWQKRDNEDATFEAFIFAWVRVRVTGEMGFELTASDPALLDQKAGGAPLKIEGYGGLYAVLRTTAAHARTKPNRVADEFKQKTAALPTATEAERLVVQRVGQGLFRIALLDYWQGQCCITGLDVPALLRASHIRPWAQCETDEQRLDVYNGLLLAPHLDALFDAGLMTVDTAGVAQLSAQLTAKRRAALGLEGEMRIADLRAEHHAYLRFHRLHVWAG